MLFFLSLFFLLASFSSPSIAQGEVNADAHAEASATDCGGPRVFDTAIQELSNRVDPPPSPYTAEVEANVDVSGGFSIVQVRSEMASASITGSFRQASRFCGSFWSLPKGSFDGRLTDKLTFEVVTQDPPSDSSQETIIPLQLITQTVRGDSLKGFRFLSLNPETIGTPFLFEKSYRFENIDNTPVSGSIAFTGGTATFFVALLSAFVTDLRPPPNDVGAISTASDHMQLILEMPPGVRCTSVSGEFPGCETPASIHSIEFTQAIQESLTPEELKEYLASHDGRLPAPIVAGKPAVLRVYPSQVSEAERVTIEVNLHGLIDSKALELNANCTPENRRSNDVVEGIRCRSADFPFTPPAGTWSATVTVKDDAGMELESHSFNITSQSKRVPVYWIVPINTGTRASPVLPSNAEISKQQSYLKTVFPARDVKFVRRSWEEIGPTTIEKVERDLKLFYWGNLLAWNVASKITGKAPFEFPDQIYGVTSEGRGSSDPVWVGGRGSVAWGKAGLDASLMAHEINHNLDRSKAGTWGRHVPLGCDAPEPNPEWPYANDDIQEVGFDTRLGSANTVIRNIFPDFMSYCLALPQPNKWISPYRWEKLLGSFSSASPSGPASLSGALEDIQTVYYISAQVNVDGTGALDPVLVQPGIPTEEVLPGDYSIEVRDGSGGLLLEVPFFVSFVNVEGDEVATVYRDFQLPEQAGASQILLKRGEQILDTLDVSDNSPTVTVLEPNGGETWSGLQTIRWTAGDLDEDPLSFTVLYTPTDGALWVPVASNLQGDSYEVDTSILPGGGQARIRVIVTDGFNTSEDDSDENFAVPRKPPEAAIFLPGDGAHILSGTAILFRGEANDVEDGPLTGDSLAWTSDRDGFLGNDDELLITGLSQGTHLITLTATDGDGSEDADSVTVFVEGECGDLNDDGVVDILDAVIELQVAVGLIIPTIDQARLGDLNRDGDVDVFDAIMGLRHIVGLTPALEACGLE